MAEKYASEESFASWMLCIWGIIVYGFLRTLVVYPFERIMETMNIRRYQNKACLPVYVRVILCCPVQCKAACVASSRDLQHEA
jgi:uncharacterized membrane protein